MPLIIMSLCYVVITITVHLDYRCVTTRMSSFVIDSVICKYHMYEAIWEPIDGDKVEHWERNWKPSRPASCGRNQIVSQSRTYTRVLSHMIISSEWKSLDGFSKVNAWLFVKFAKLSHYTVLDFGLPISHTTAKGKSLAKM